MRHVVTAVLKTRTSTVNAKLEYTQLQSKLLAKKESENIRQAMYV